ncbi:ribonuclease domain-containing protein [Epilithonimonas mollis]|uniref:Ribonuclease n=1 Tax=Epilithonimonas mollis TaxID=216903 RepID=A0A1M6TKN4_9FLAO|nr:ribonuclease domain-containing protein [Epilithonimonas mollis]SHK57459.1 ribonuclease [Epilithonimonas mollis]
MDFVPGFGDDKGVIEGLSGTDMQSNKLSWFDRGLSLMFLSELRGAKNITKEINKASKFVQELSPLKKGIFNNAKLRPINKILDEIKTGTAKGHTYLNDGRDGSQILPKKGKNGDITYQTYDISSPPTAEQRANGATRDKARIIVGDDGSVWHTNQHYKKGSIQKISK